MKNTLKEQSQRLVTFETLLTFLTKTQQVINKISSKRGQDHATSRSFLLRQSAVLSLVY